MKDIARLRQRAIGRLNELPLYKLIQVLDYIDSLLERSSPIVPPRPGMPRGSLQDLLACAGTWEFEPGELEEISQDIEESRLMELEDTHDSLSA